jgi:hypothetical protein
MRLLIVEDDAALGQGLRSHLASQGYAVDLATNGIDGAHLGATEPYDAVILDLGLPGKPGSPCCATGGRRQPGAGAGAHRPRRLGRAGRGPAGRRRRLPRQALPHGRAGRPHPGPAAPRRAGPGAPAAGRQVAPRRRPPAAGGRRRPRADAHRHRVPPAALLHAPPRRGALQEPWPSTFTISTPSATAT